MAFPYIGGQIPQPSNPVETAARSFGMTQKAIADNLALQQQKQFSKAYPQLLQDQLKMSGLKLAEQETASQYAPQTAEANYAKLLAETERMETQNIFAEETALANIAAIEALEAQRLSAAEKNRRQGVGSGISPYGYSGQIMSIDAMRQAGFFKEADLLERTLLANTQNAENRLNATALSTMVPGEKNEFMARGSQLTGGDVAAFNRLVIEGKSLTEIGDLYGFTPEQVAEIVPDYAMTTPMVTRVQQMELANYESEILMPIVTDYIGQYQTELPIKGYSLEQITDLLKGENPDKQAKFLAGNYLYSELAGANAKSVLGQVGIEALQKFEDRAAFNYNVSKIGITPQIFEETNHLIDQALKYTSAMAIHRLKTEVSQVPPDTFEEFLALDAEVHSDEFTLEELMAERKLRGGQ